MDLPNKNAEYMKTAVACFEATTVSTNSALNNQQSIRTLVDQFVPDQILVVFLATHDAV